LEAESLLAKTLSRDRGPKTIEDGFGEKFRPFINKTDTEILKLLNTTLGRVPKNYKRLLVNKILGVTSNKVEELEKANVVLKVITLEPSGSLTESMSFPAFDYRDIVSQVWDDEDDQKMSDLHTLLETNKFLFVIFQKIAGSEDVILKKTMFWNFPMNDIEEARRVWEKTKECIINGHYSDLPKITDGPIVHVRPHGKDASDTMITPQGTQDVKRCFWLNAKYIQKVIGEL
jgi:DNA mismatch repair protein MutH